MHVAKHKDATGWQDRIELVPITPDYWQDAEHNNIKMHSNMKRYKVAGGRARDFGALLVAPEEVLGRKEERER